jgi:hypothetical protein
MDEPLLTTPSRGSSEDADETTGRRHGAGENNDSRIRLAASLHQLAEAFLDGYDTLKQFWMQRSPLRIARGSMLLVVLVFCCIMIFLLLLLILHKAPAAAKNKHSVPLFAQKIPSLTTTIDLAYLSREVYRLKHANQSCLDFVDPTPGGAGDWTCQWYHHEFDLGTQVLLLVSEKRQQIVIAFAGTDDLRTSLEDADLRMTPFGDNTTIRLPNDEDADDIIKVHAGFNSAVFSHSIYHNLTRHHLQPLLLRSKKHRPYKIITTGHSLGAANAMLVAVALAHDQELFATQKHRYKQTILSVGFGTPKTGNVAWRDYFNTTALLPSTIKDDNINLSIFRVVLGYDLVPRLPSSSFTHIGHTIQLWPRTGSRVAKTTTHHKNENVVDSMTKENDHQQQQGETATIQWKWDRMQHNNEESLYIESNSTTTRIEMYYHHYGDEALGYAGVPSGWDSKPYIFVPGALMDHSVRKYIHELEQLISQQQAQDDDLCWSKSSFVPIVQPDDNDKDDDEWAGPPDDDDA